MTEMLNSGVLVRSFLGVLFGVTVCGLAIQRVIPPDWFLVIASLVIGYWFGSDGASVVANTAKRLMNGSQQ